LPERFSFSVPPVANDICRSAVPAPKYLPERRSTAFPHHYTPANNASCNWVNLVQVSSVQFGGCEHGLTRLVELASRDVRRINAAFQTKHGYNSLPWKPGINNKPAGECLRRAHAQTDGHEENTWYRRPMGWTAEA